MREENREGNEQMKVKHVFCNSIDAASGYLEKRIDNFIKDKKVIDIKHSSSSVSSDIKFCNINYSALIMYED